MRTYVVERLVDTGLTCVAISFVVFVFLHLAGDPAKVLLPPEASKEAVADLRRSLGLDDPFFVQYGRFLANALRGEFGDSFIIRDKALAILLERAPATIELALAGLLVGVALAVPLGILAAYRPRSWVDHLASIVSVVGQAVPTFWLGILLILVFAVQLRWFPVYGGEGLMTLVLPAVTLGVWAMARTARITRSSMLEVLHQDFLRTARAKGVGEWSVILRHALRNCAIPIVTALGLELGNLLGGAVITEAVFAYPGIGRLAVEAVINKDVPLIQAVVLTVGAAILLLNILIDVVYVALDPRIRLA